MMYASLDSGGATSFTSYTWIFFLFLSVAIAAGVHWILSLRQHLRQRAPAEMPDMDELRKRRLAKTLSASSAAAAADSNDDDNDDPALKKKQPPRGRAAAAAASFTDPAPLSAAAAGLQKKPPAAGGGTADAAGAVALSLKDPPPVATMANDNNDCKNKNIHAAASPKVPPLIMATKDASATLSSTASTTTTTTTTALKDPPAKPATKKRDKKPALPANQLCAILSNIFEASVLPEDVASNKNNPTAPSSSALSTKQRTATAAVVAVVSMTTNPLTLPKITTDLSWEELRARFLDFLVREQQQQIQPSLWYQAKPSGAGHLSWLLQRHDRVVVNLTQLQPSSNEDDNNNNNQDDIRRLCLKKLQEWIWYEIHRRLAPEVVATADNDGAFDDMKNIMHDDLPDLFADEDVETELNEGAIVGPNTQEWLTLFENMNPTLTPTLLEGIFSVDSNNKKNGDEHEKMVTFWMREICRRLSLAYQRPSMEVISILPQRCNAFMHLWAQSAQLRQIYEKQLLLSSNVNTPGPETGLALEQSVPWAELCRAAAFCLPTSQIGEGPSSLFGRMLIQAVAPQEPDQVGRLVFSRDAGRDVHQTLDSSRRLMQTARVTGQSFWRLWIKSMEDKSVVFAWFRQVIQKNDSLTEMLHADLLSSDGIVQLSSSWRFLMGLSSTIVGLCAESMQQRLEKKGKDAFDSRYLDYFGMVDERYRLASSKQSSDTNKNLEELKFDGATEFFFLSSALLHVSLYPMLRIENAFLRQYNKLLIVLQDLEKRKAPVPPHLQENSKNAVVAWLGYDAFLDDPEWISKMTQLALTQLQWIRNVVVQNDPRFAQHTAAHIPDWFCKEPARWLAHVARKVPNSLKAYQADLTVDVTTQLLTVGSRDKSSPISFSPLVLTELIHVASAFVEAGARRAKQKQKNGRRRRGLGNSQNDEEYDDGDDGSGDELGVYLSFDQNDLGAAVFTNRRVCEELCPTLLKTFRALDHIEGLNVDAEASFDKFSVKVEIARLLTRLWRHPNGECQKSIVQLPAEEISLFASSVAAAIGYLLDDACQRYSDVVKLSRRDTRSLSPEDRAFQDKQTRGAVNGFLCGRTFLVLLHRLSENKGIARAIGQGSSAHEMATMLVHFLDILTDPDGGMHPDLDILPQQDRTSAMLQRTGRMLAGEKTKLASDVATARRNTKRTIGLDVSEISHMFLALASRWFVASSNGDGPALITALASQDDCDVAKYRAVTDRLIQPKNAVLEKDPLSAVFRHDGHVDASLFPSDSTTEPLTEIHRSLIQSARKCHLSHEEISSIAKREHVLLFLDAVQSAKEKLATDVELRGDDIRKALEKIMAAPLFSSESAYGDALSAWTVSSEAFSESKDGKSLLHFFDKAARERGTSGSGKTLVKEARKCHKGIPIPHPNSAIFVCFAEERMDLCRAVVLGPVETPYSLGAFVFDVYFPPSYPHIPPLLNFMTTGGGQVRFGPNLYQDGKVCLSLLGTFHAGDVSQQWNPSISSLAQILLSIQTQLLVKDPYFLEPGNESIMQTPAGQETSHKYNMRRRLDTLRHAILGPLIAPPLGFKEVLNKHFALCRQRIVIQARRWALEARGTQLEARFEKVYGQILSRLICLDSVLLDLPPLEPLKEDVQFLTQNDPTFLLDYISKSELKPAATTASATSVAAPPLPSASSAAVSPWGADFNPWGGGVDNAAADIMAMHSGTPFGTVSKDDDDDDDFYA